MQLPSIFLRLIFLFQQVLSLSLFQHFFLYCSSFSSYFFFHWILFQSLSLHCSFISLGLIYSSNSFKGFSFSHHLFISYNPLPSIWRLFWDKFFFNFFHPTNFGLTFFSLQFLSPCLSINWSYFSLKFCLFFRYNLSLSYILFLRS